MDKKRTVEDIEKDFDNLYQKFIENKEKIGKEKEALDFKLQILEKVYMKKKIELEIEQSKIIENEVRKELGL